jgi:hypothetical protein
MEVGVYLICDGGQGTSAHHFAINKMEVFGLI